MRPRAAPASPQLTLLLQEVAEQGAGFMDELLRPAREALLQQIDQTSDFFERELRARAAAALTQAVPELRARYPQVLRAAFGRALDDQPLTTAFDTGPVSIRFDQLELMDEQQVQARISAVRGVQQVMLESEAELAELNALVSGLLGLAQVQPERNPLRPEIFLEALQGLLGEMPGDAVTHNRWVQTLVPLLGPQLRALYQQLLRRLRQQRVQPARYAIVRPAAAGMPAGVASGGAPLTPGPAAVQAAGHAPARRTGDVRSHLAGPASRPTAPAASAARLTVQQLHGLVSGRARVDDALVQEVVNLIIANIAGDPRILPPVWQLVYELEPALLALARSDPDFFHEKQHPARQLLEQIAQRSFAYESVDALGFEAFLGQLQQALHEIDPARAASPAPFAGALARLRRQWAQADQAQQAQQQAAVQALQQAEQRNQLARQIAEHIRAQPDTVLVPDGVVEFACGPWAQVMAQAQIAGRVGQAGAPDHVALLEDLFWSVRPDQTRQQPGQLVKLIPVLVQGLRQGLASIHYPAEQAEAFFAELFALHQGGMGAGGPARAATLPRAAGRPWLAPAEARESGFMDDLGGGDDAPGFAATQPAGLPGVFPATEPMSLEERQLETGAVPLEPAAPAQPLALDQLQPGSWIELLVSGQWMRLHLVWLNANASLCLFSSAGGSNHSMTRRMFDRLVGQQQLRLLAQGEVVERAFDAVAELAMRNSVYMDLQANPDPGG